MGNLGITSDIAQWIILTAFPPLLGLVRHQFNKRMEHLEARLSDAHKGYHELSDKINENEIKWRDNIMSNYVKKDDLNQIMASKFDVFEGKIDNLTKLLDLAINGDLNFGGNNKKK